MFSSRECLDHAEARFREGTFHALLYAALDLRLGTEARLHEYHEAAEQVVTLKKRGWKVRELGQELERVFRLREQVAVFDVRDSATGERIRLILHTPVRRRLGQIAERLGDYLHVTPRMRPESEKWLVEFRDLVAEGMAQLRFSTTGTMLAPPLRDPATGEARVFVEVLPGEDVEEAKVALGGVGVLVNVTVSYRDDLPAP